MNLKPRSIILLAIDAFGGQVGGKTLLQKRLYFTEILAKKDLGLEFDAHYYGPYSAVISGELSTLKLQDQVREDASTWGFSNQSGFEIRRYCYELTPDGKTGVDWLRENYSADSKRIGTAARLVVEAGNLDYMELSFAAKSYWILRRANKPLAEADIAKEAGRYGWEVKREHVNRGVEFLHQVGLVQSASETTTS